MKKMWYRAAAAALAATMLCTQGMSVSAQPDTQTAGDVSVEYLTVQPGATTASVNLNWYAPDGTEQAMVKFGDITAKAVVSELTADRKSVV